MINRYRVDRYRTVIVDEKAFEEHFEKGYPELLRMGIIRRVKVDYDPSDNDFDPYTRIGFFNRLKVGILVLLCSFLFMAILFFIIENFS